MNSRRRFLQRLSLAAGLPLLRFDRNRETMDGGGAPEEPLLRVAIMGLGGYGTRVAEAMQGCKKSKARRRDQRHAVQNRLLEGQVRYP